MKTLKSRQHKWSRLHAKLGAKVKSASALKSGFTRQQSVVKFSGSSMVSTQMETTCTSYRKILKGQHNSQMLKRKVQVDKVIMPISGPQTQATIQAMIQVHVDKAKTISVYNEECKQQLKVQAF